MKNLLILLTILLLSACNQPAPNTHIQNKTVETKNIYEIILYKGDKPADIYNTNYYRISEGFIFFIDLEDNTELSLSGTITVKKLK